MEDACWAPLPVTFGPHWADELMLWVTAAGVIVTALVAFLTFRANRTSSKAQKLATEAMESAIKVNALAAQRQSDALSRLVDSVNARSAEGDGRGAKWELVKIEGRNLWAIKNIGSGIARAAVVLPATADALADFHALTTSPVDVAPGAQLPFVVERSMASPETTLVNVVWKDASGNEQSTMFMVA